VEIIGVDDNTLRAGLAGRLVPEVYCAYAQFPAPGPTIIVRAAAGDPLQLVRTVEDRIAALDLGVATHGPKRLSDVVSDTVADRRILSMLLGLFAALALVLTGLGIAGVVSFVVAQRTQEIGVRMALGADPGAVLWMVLRGAMTPVAVGVLLGAVASLPFTRLIQRFLFQVKPTDPSALAGGAAVLILGALVAAYLPARRATRIDPLVALRNS
jgi:putative ABC transport system permease protein